MQLLEDERLYCALLKSLIEVSISLEGFTEMWHTHLLGAVELPKCHGSE